MSKKQSSRGGILSTIMFLVLAVVTVSTANAAEDEMGGQNSIQSTASDPLSTSSLDANSFSANKGGGTAGGTTTASIFGSNVPAKDVPIPKVSVVDSLQDHATADELFSVPDEQERQAFHAMTKSTMPMSPGQVIRLHRMLNMMQKAVAASPGTPPLPVVTTRIVSLAPGSTPPVIRLGQGFVTSVLFVDATGQPWPIAGYDLGDSKTFNIQPPQKGGNMMMIQAMKPYTYGNMAVSLKGMTTPVMLTLVPGQRVVDYRVDLHVNKIGPKGLRPTGSANLPAPASDVLLDVLNGISPKGATVLKVSGGQGESEAWLVGHKLYLRTRLTIISPAWLSMMRSADGTNAYEMELTPSILVSRAGRLINLEIEGL